MKTKLLLCTAALAAASVSSNARQVGYVTYVFHAFDYTLVCNPLDNVTNDLNTIIPYAPGGSSIALWSTPLQDFSPTAPQYIPATHSWFPDVQIQPCEGFFVIANADFTNTFIGSVRHYAITNTAAGNFNYNCRGGPLPLAGGVTNQLIGYPASPGDSVAIWSVPLKDFSPVSPQFIGGRWSPDYIFTPGEAFFLVRAGGPITWISTFPFDVAAGPAAQLQQEIVLNDGCFGVRSNCFGFNVAGPSNQVVIVEACTSLTDPTWVPLQTNTMAAAPVYFRDPNWTNYPARFYQLREQ